MQRVNPLTSLLAHDSVKDHKEAVRIKIVDGLKKLKIGGTFEEIATSCGLEPQQVWKRLSEMERKEIIFSTKITRKGSSGRQCMVWQLVPEKLVQKELF